MERSECCCVSAVELNETNLCVHDSTVAVALWAMDDTPVSPTLQLVVDGVLDGGVGPIASNNPRFAPRT